MRCQKCGKNEVSFHYSSNINGCVTETNLCQDCADMQGYNIWSMFSPVGIRNSFLPVFTFTSQPAIGGRVCTGEGSCECDSTNSVDTGVDVDMKKRRELYMQLHAAAESEEFEKAAMLRDELKEMEI